MCQTLGCNVNHTGAILSDRVAAVMAADQGEQTYNWEWPLKTSVAAQPRHRRKGDVKCL